LIARATLSSRVSAAFGQARVPIADFFSKDGASDEDEIIWIGLRVKEGALTSIDIDAESIVRAGGNLLCC
jgi:hypothetical protein